MTPSPCCSLDYFIRCFTFGVSMHLVQAYLWVLTPWILQAPKDYDILAIPLTSTAIKMLKLRKGTPEEWRQYLSSEQWRALIMALVNSSLNKLHISYIHLFLLRLRHLQTNLFYHYFQQAFCISFFFFPSWLTQLFCFSLRSTNPITTNWLYVTSFWGPKLSQPVCFLIWIDFLKHTLKKLSLIELSLIELDHPLLLILLLIWAQIRSKNDRLIKKIHEYKFSLVL